MSVTTTKISIEKIATGTRIEVPGFRDAEVMEIEFDGSGYLVTYCTNDRYGWDALDRFYLDAGQTVEAYDYQTHLRADAEITVEERQAKGDAISAATDVLLGKINAAQGHVCQPIDERPLVEAVAAAVGVPALESEAA